jgi:hypothetical protein
VLTVVSNCVYESSEPDVDASVVQLTIPLYKIFLVFSGLT